MGKRGETLTPTLFSDLFRSELEEIVAKAVRAVELVIRCIRLGCRCCFVIRKRS